MTDNPSFYIYEDAGTWRKTDKSLTDKLNSPTFNDPSLLTGHSFYPQWPEPEFKSQTRYAWRITPDGDKVVRTREIETGDKRRPVARVPLYLRWDAVKRFWVVVETPETSPQ